MRLPVALAILLLLAAPLAAGQLLPGSGRGIVLNLHYARDAGCSGEDDGWLFWYDGPDLEARLYHDGALVYKSPQRQDTRAPEWREYVELPDIPRPAKLQLEVREGEPNATTLGCDITPTSGDLLELTVGVAGISFDTQGSSANGARLVGRVGPIDAPRPAVGTPELVEATNDSITIAWKKGANEVVTLQKIESRHAGDRDPGPAATSYKIEGLRQDWPYDFTLLREGEGWSVRGPRVDLRTGASPPGVPVLGVVAGIEEINVTWSAQYADAVELHVGEAEDFAPSAGTLRHTGGASGEATLSGLPANRELYVRAVATGRGGVSDPTDAAKLVLEQRPAPPAPSVLATRSEHAGLRVEWSAPTTAGVAHHEIMVGNVTHRAGANETSALVGGIAPAREHAVRVRAVNANGLFNDSATTRVRFDPPNAAPTIDARFSHPRPRVGAPVTLAVGARDADGDALVVRVDWGDGSPVETIVGANATHAYASAGNRTATALAMDAYGAEARVTANVSVVENTLPVARLVLAADRIAPGEWLTADARGSADVDGDALSFTFDWGDGVVERAGSLARHQYAREGSYQVVVTTGDGFGQTNASAQLTVARAAAPTTATTPPTRASTTPATPSAAPSQATTSATPRATTASPPLAPTQASDADATGEARSTDEPALAPAATPEPPTAEAPRVEVPAAGGALALAALVVVALAARRR